MSSDYKISFTLKQHTPLIHFQHGEPGATLRATELKPKLDKFLLSRIKGLPVKNHPNGAKSLDYKVSIYYNGINHKDYPKPFISRNSKTGYQAPYFADGISIEHNGLITLIFKSFNQKILESIENNIHLFFTFENFGARQSKGFGSFHDEKIKKSEFESYLLQNELPVYKLNKKAKNPKDALKKIDIFYKELKSGINFPTYKKSLLFKYLCNNKIGWEKRWLKNNFPQIIHGNHTPVQCHQQPKSYKYIRAMLGLAEHNEYRPDGNKLQIKIESTEKVDNKPKYQRFKSPITFKVFDNEIYLLHNRSYEQLLNKSFDFILNGETKTISTPENFCLTDFLNFVEKQGYISRLKGKS